jgi:hypothetical protein
MTRHVAIISEHASPLACLGGPDAGGQNVYVDQVARQLARLGDRVDVFTRRDAPDLPEIVPLATSGTGWCAGCGMGVTATEDARAVPPSTSSTRTSG